MRITAIKTHYRYYGDRSWVITEMQTDEGITGFSEVGKNRERAVAAMVYPHLFGREQQMLERGTFRMEYGEFDWRLNEMGTEPFSTDRAPWGTEVARASSHATTASGHPTKRIITVPRSGRHGTASARTKSSARAPLRLPPSRGRARRSRAPVARAVELLSR